MKLLLLTGMTLLLLIGGGWWFPGDTWLFWSSGSIVAIAAICLRFQRSWFVGMARWAKAHPFSSQVILTLIQLGLVPLAVYAGYNLSQLGLEFSEIGYLVFGSLFLLSFFLLPFLPRKKWLSLPKEFQQHRLAAIGLAGSAFAILLLFGNRLPDQHPDSVVLTAVEKADHFLFPDQAVEERAEQQLAFPQTSLFHLASQRNLSLDTESEAPRLRKKALRKAQRQLKRQQRAKRKAAGAGICVLSVVLILLLAGVLCAGICLIVLSGTVAGLIGGIVLVPLSIAGIVGSIKMCANRIQGNRPNSNE